MARRGRFRYTRCSSFIWKCTSIQQLRQYRGETIHHSISVYPALREFSVRTGDSDHVDLERQQAFLGNRD